MADKKEIIIDSIEGDLSDNNIDERLGGIYDTFE
jgi:hypothetical protein